MVYGSMKRANHFNQDIAVEAIAIKRLIAASTICVDIERIQVYKEIRRKFQ